MINYFYFLRCRPDGPGCGVGLVSVDIGSSSYNRRSACAFLFLSPSFLERLVYWSWALPSRSLWHFVYPGCDFVLVEIEGQCSPLGMPTRVLIPGFCSLISFAILHMYLYFPMAYEGISLWMENDTLCPSLTVLSIASKILSLSARDGNSTLKEGGPGVRSDLTFWSLLAAWTLTSLMPMASRASWKACSRSLKDSSPSFSCSCADPFLGS